MGVHFILPFFLTQFRETEYGSQGSFIKPVFFKENFVYSNIYISILLLIISRSRRKFLSTSTKYQLDRRSLRQARKVIPAVTFWLPLDYCRNLDELVPVKGGIISSSLFLIKGNPILPMTPKDGCAIEIGCILSLLLPLIYQKVLDKN